MALLAAAGFGQQQPVSQSSGAVAEAAQAADQRNAEWNALTASLEQRVARMLPCDARVLSAIDEVARASDVRFAAMTAYWQAVENRSKEQAARAGATAAEIQPRVAASKNELADSEQMQTQFEGRAAELREAMNKLPTLGRAAEDLDVIEEQSETVEGRSRERLNALAALSERWSDVIRASERRDAALENVVKALASERDRWKTFYAARAARARTECTLTSAAGAPAPGTDAPRNSGAKRP